MTRLYVTGASGFAGRWLERLVLNKVAFKDVQWVTPIKRVDIRDLAGLQEQISSAAPNWVIHMAAQSSVPISITKPAETFEVNASGTLALLSVLRNLKFRGRVLYVSSSDAYGNTSADDLPILEEHPLKPLNPYAVSKAAAELICRQWTESEGLDIVIARPFNHFGPGQGSNFAVANFARQVASISLGNGVGQIIVGDIHTTRDFTDVRDVVDAYINLLRFGRSGETYNVCSGEERSLKSILDALIHIGNVEVTLREDLVPARKGQQRRVVGSNQKLRNTTGWRPRKSLNETLTDVFNYWLEKLTT